MQVPKGRPKLTEIRIRHHAYLQEDGKPFYLEVHDKIHPKGGAYNPKVAPRDCAGPGEGKCCGRKHYCCYCYERYARKVGVQVAMVHIGQPNLHWFKIRLDKIGGRHPKHAKDCMRRVLGVLRRHNFSRQALFLHTFGQNPFDGPQASIEGIVSGFDADPDVLDADMPGGLGLILKRFRSAHDSALPIEIEVERLHPHSRKHVDDLVQRAIDAARPSFPVRRIHAGLWTDKRGRTRCTMTDVRDGIRPAGIKRFDSPSPDHIPDATEDDILTMAVVADSWDGSVGRPTITRGQRTDPSFVGLVLRATQWRPEWRLPTDADLRRRWEAESLVHESGREQSGIVGASKNGHGVALH